MKMQLPVIKCDKACSGADIKETIINGERGILLQENDKYKYLTIIPAFKDGAYAVLCSEDMKKWSFCFGAWIDGEQWNLNDIIEMLKDHYEEMNDTKQEEIQEHDKDN